jgi:uncharacterized protein
MVRLEPHGEGVILPVRAQPGARRSGIRGEQDGMLKVGVTQPAEKGKANKALLAVLAKELGLRKSRLTLLSGETAQNKRFLVRAIDSEQLAERIAAALAMCRDSS